jgi:N utilization substance protein A
MKGIRIQAISRELNNEKIDVINWHSDPGIFISRSLSPAKVSKVIVDQNKRKAIAILSDDQVSLAIGRGGQNRRLASRLTDYEIEIIKESDYIKIMEIELDQDNKIMLNEVEGITPTILKKLNEAGYETTDDVSQAGVKGLTNISGVGEKTANKILELINKD